jgi:uncharacterized protein (DUF433 family)
MRRTSAASEPDRKPQTLIGTGIYSIPEAARLTRIPPARIRRWVAGYAFGTRSKRRLSPPVVRAQLPVLEGQVALGFLDLLEVRFVDAFRTAGVGWKAIRLAHERARELFETQNPFSTKAFRTDGRRIFADVVHDAGEEGLLDLVSNEWAFGKILKPYLYEGLEFVDEQAIRWWPMGLRRQVVLDPKRSFGQPVVDREGVPTAVLAGAYAAEESIEAVSRWYEVEPSSVRDAVEFEKSLAA